MARLEPQAARRAQALDRQTDADARRVPRLLDEFRARSKADLDALNELTRLLPPPIWTSQVEIKRDTVTYQRRSRAGGGAAGRGRRFAALSQLGILHDRAQPERRDVPPPHAAGSAQVSVNATNEPSCCSARRCWSC